LTGQVKFGGPGNQYHSNGYQIELTTSHPSNVQISPSSIPVPAGTTNATFNFQVTLTNTKSNCLSSPVKISARVRGAPDEAWRRVAIEISPQP
jgi:hypothetical protein